MANIVVEVSTVDEIRPHPGADKLEIAVVKGWQVVVPIGVFTVGESVVYIPPDAVLPTEVSDHMGVTKYLSKGRVRAIKLRGEPSFGFLFRPDGSYGVSTTCRPGTDVASSYGITKYEPPVKLHSGDAEAEHPAFFKYTDIENMRNYPKVFEAGEQVAVSEKIHGTNCRIGIVDGTWMAGSHSVRRKKPDTGEAWNKSLYWFPWTDPHVKMMMVQLYQEYKHVILYGEIYGRVQELKYGHDKDVAFAAFDLVLDHKFVDIATFEEFCYQYKVPTVPRVGSVPFNLDCIRKLAEGKTLVPGADNIREGVVVRPMHERTHPKIGRVILKYVGDSYLCSKTYNSNKDV